MNFCHSLLIIIEFQCFTPQSGPDFSTAYRQSLHIRLLPRMYEAWRDWEKGENWGAKFLKKCLGSLSILNFMDHEWKTQFSCQLTLSIKTALKGSELDVEFLGFVGVYCGFFLIHLCLSACFAVMRSSGSFTSSFVMKSIHSGEILSNASSLKSYFPTVTLPIVSTSQLPQKGLRPLTLNKIGIQCKYFA